MLLLGCGLLVRSWRVSYARYHAISEQDYYRLIAESAGDVFFKVQRSSARISWSSDPAAEILEYDPDELELQPDNIEQWIYADDRRAFREAWDGLLEGRRVDLDVRLITKHGSRRWVHILAVPVAVVNGAPFQAVGVVRNTDRLHEMQEELAESRRLQLAGTLASGIAHEFNNLLTPIRGFIELALDHLGPNHVVSDGLQTALGRVEHCAHLVSQIQAYGRKSLLMPEPVDLNALLPSVIRVAMSAFRGRGLPIELHQEWAHDLPPLWVDRSQFQEAVVQLVRNAIEAMPQGGMLTVRAEALFVKEAKSAAGQVRHGGEYLCLTVGDTGVGMAPEIIDQIFDPFFTTHGRAGKRGMGLSVVQGMVAQHGGWLEIKSAPGKGSEIRMFLPLQPVKAPPEQEGRVDVDGTMQVLPAAPVGRLLVGEDEEHIRRLVAKVFASEGWEVEEVGNYEEVLARVDNGSFDYDLLILDMTMGGPPLERVLESVVSRHPEAAVVIMSGFDADDRVKRLLLGHRRVGFMHKPFSPKDLLQKVDTLLG